MSLGTGRGHAGNEVVRKGAEDRPCSFQRQGAGTPSDTGGDQEESTSKDSKGGKYLKREPGTCSGSHLISDRFWNSNPIGF